jgi:hypothetical protein
MEINSNENKSYLSNYKNEKGLIIIFCPIILFSVLFISVDTYSDYSEFEAAYDYFINFYAKRLFLFSMVIIFWKKAKQLISGYVLLVIFYLFNILLVLSDSFNIDNFLLEYESKNQGSTFYQNMIIKKGVNYFFFYSWTSILIFNLYKWYVIYKNSQSIYIEEKDG